MYIDDKSKCTGDFYYGPAATCSGPAPLPTPTPEPTPYPTPLPGDQCGNYKDCDTCTSHFADRNCGWCMASGESGTCYEASKSTCDAKYFYYNTTVCNQPVPPPSPTPWPRYEANTTFCKLLSGTWCEKCVSTQPNMSCVWCHASKECVMGDSEGPFFGSCPSNTFSYKADDQCLGKIAKGKILAIRIVVGILVTAFIAAGIFICYKEIKKPA